MQFFPQRIPLLDVAASILLSSNESAMLLRVWLKWLKLSTADIKGLMLSISTLVLTILVFIIPATSHKHYAFIFTYLQLEPEPVC